jgi:hypothetical protein
MLVACVELVDSPFLHSFLYMAMCCDTLSYSHSFYM